MRPIPALLLSAALIATTGCDSFRESFTRGRDAAVDRQLAEVASKMNKTLPMMVDKDTQLDNLAALPGKVLQYNCTLVTIEAAQIDASRLERAFKPALLDKVRTTPEMSGLRSLGVTFVYSYRDKNGVSIARYEFGPKDYNG